MSNVKLAVQSTVSRAMLRAAATDGWRCYDWASVKGTHYIGAPASRVVKRGARMPAAASTMNPAAIRRSVSTRPERHVVDSSGAGAFYARGFTLSRALPDNVCRASSLSCR